MYAAYLDRFTDNEMALFIVEELKKEFYVQKKELPLGSSAGTWFRAAIEEDEIYSLVFDEDKTNAMKNEIENRMRRLQSNRKSKFKRR